MFFVRPRLFRSRRGLIEEVPLIVFVGIHFGRSGKFGAVKFLSSEVVMHWWLVNTVSRFGLIK